MFYSTQVVHLPHTRIHYGRSASISSSTGQVRHTLTWSLWEALSVETLRPPENVWLAMKESV